MTYKATGTESDLPRGDVTRSKSGNGNAILAAVPKLVGGGEQQREGGWRQGGREAVLASSSQKTLDQITAWGGWAGTGTCESYMERKFHSELCF